MHCVWCGAATAAAIAFAMVCAIYVIDVVRSFDLSATGQDGAQQGRMRVPPAASSLCCRFAR